MYNDVVQPDRPQMAIWRMRILCRLTKLTDTLSECIILIAGGLQQWIRDSASLLHYTCIVCLVYQLTTLTHSLLERNQIKYQLCTNFNLNIL